MQKDIKMIEKKLDWIAFLLSNMFTKQEMIDMINAYQKKEWLNNLPNFDKERL